MIKNLLLFILLPVITRAQFNPSGVLQEAKRTRQVVQSEIDNITGQRKRITDLEARLAAQESQYDQLVAAQKVSTQQVQELQKQVVVVSQAAYRYETFFSRITQRMNGLEALIMSQRRLIDSLQTLAPTPAPVVSVIPAPVVSVTTKPVSASSVAGEWHRFQGEYRRPEPVDPTPSPTVGHRTTTTRRAAPVRQWQQVYHTGPRGGCFYYTASGRKEYVDRSLCR